MLALGGGSFGTATVAAQQERVAVFAFKYYPGADFDVVAQLETSTTVNVLQSEGETVPEISQPDEWTGHIIRYDVGQDAGITTFMFLRDQSLSAGDSGTLGTDASMLSPQLNLLNTSLGNGGDGGNGDGGAEETATPTPTEATNETGNDTGNESGSGGG